MKKYMLNLCLGIMTVLLASCGGGSRAALDGYDFQGDGILGKIPMSLGIKLGTARQIHEEYKDKGVLRLAPGERPSEAQIKELEDVAKEIDQKYAHCLDDIQEDLAADSARLLALKGINWVNKTACKVNLKEFKFYEKSSFNGYVSRNPRLIYEVNPGELEALVNKRLYYVKLDKQGKSLGYNDLLQVSGEDGRNLLQVEIRLERENLDFGGMMEAASTEGGFESKMNDIMKLDSIFKIEILDGDQILDYRPSTMTLTGVGPVQIGVDMDSIPKTAKDIYQSRTEIMNPEAEIFAFGFREDDTYFTGIGGSDGKLKSIEVESDGIPLKVGDMVLRVGDTYCKIVEKYGKKISWSYNPDNMELQASLEGGKVTFNINSSSFTAAGQAKFEQLENGAKNIVFVSSDFDPEAKLETYTIQ